MRVRTGSFGFVAAACACIFMSPTIAVAQPPEVKPGSHCVTNLDSKISTCYDTFREAIAAATGGRITNASQEKAAKEDRFVDRLNASTETTTSRTSTDNQVIGVVYDGADFRGPSHIYWAESQCSNDGAWNYHLENLGEWNNRISSLQVSGNCYMDLFTNQNFQGPHQLFTSHTGYMPGMTEQAESIGWT